MVCMVAMIFMGQDSDPVRNLALAQISQHTPLGGIIFPNAI